MPDGESLSTRREFLHRSSLAATGAVPVPAGIVLVGCSAEKPAVPAKAGNSAGSTAAAAG